MKRILGFSSVPPDITMGGGPSRIANLYRFLPDGYEGTLLALTGVRDRTEEGGVLGPVTVELLPSPAQTLCYYLQKYRIAPFFHVSSLHRRFPSGAAVFLKRRYDIAQFDSLWLMPWADRLDPKVPVVYASHNYETAWYESDLRRYLFPGLHRRSLAKMEKSAILRADRVVAVTEEDRDEFIRLFGVPAERTAVVPNGYDDTLFQPASDEEKHEARIRLGLPPGRRIALFAGSLVEPNREAVELILDEIASGMAGTTLFVIVGGVGTPFLDRAGGNVIVTGRVDEIAPWFRAADIGLNPILSGSGSNIKVLEYLGAGLSVISTPFGMRGFDDLLPYVTVDRPGGFSHHLEGATADPDAWKYVRERYSWRRASTRLAEVHAELLGETSPADKQ